MFARFFFFLNGKSLRPKYTIAHTHTYKNYTGNLHKSINHPPPADQSVLLPQPAQHADCAGVKPGRPVAAAVADQGVHGRGFQVGGDVALVVVAQQPRDLQRVLSCGLCMWGGGGWWGEPEGASMSCLLRHHGKGSTFGRTDVVDLLAELLEREREAAAGVPEGAVAVGGHDRRMFVGMMSKQRGLVPLGWD